MSMMESKVPKESGRILFHSLAARVVEAEREVDKSGKHEHDDDEEVSDKESNGDIWE